MSDADEAETLRRVNALVESLAEADEPYRVAVEVIGAASGAAATSITASHHYRVWAALTDRYELKPDAWAEAVADMQRAALEWLGTEDNPDARARYFDKWLHDVLGYERD